MQTELDLVHAIFGSDLDATIILQSEEPSACQCQAALAKAAQKCQETKLKEFNRCKKQALRGRDQPPVVIAQELADACLGIGLSPQPDPKGKIAKACGTKIAAAVNSSGKCQQVELSRAVPGCGTDDPGEAAACLDRLVECQVCEGANQVDGLERECDDFDDAQANASCVRGACCDGDTCKITTQQNCGGNKLFKGAGTKCDPNPCLDRACCFLDGSCLERTENECGKLAGAWDPSLRSCIPTPCPPDACAPLPCNPPAIPGAPTATGDPTMNTTTYDVTGSPKNDCRGVSKAIFDPTTGKGPPVGGVRRAGETRADIGFTFEGATALLQCPNSKWVCRAKLTSLAASMDITIKLPNWNPAPSGGVPKAWTDFLAGLTTHEQGHADRYTNNFNAYKQALLGVPDGIGSGDTEEGACDDAFDRLTQSLNRVDEAELERIEDIQKAYDKATSFGATEACTGRAMRARPTADTCSPRPRPSPKPARGETTRAPPGLAGSWGC